jgi:hypothetical protein
MATIGIKADEKFGDKNVIKSYGNAEKDATSNAF